MEGAADQASLPRQRPHKEHVGASCATQPADAGRQGSAGRIASPSSSSRSPIWPPPSSTETRAGSLGPQTPTPNRRGCRFPSLDEAHRNIASRSAQKPVAGATTPRDASCSSISTSPTNNDSTLASWTRARSRKDFAAIHDLSSTELTIGANAIALQDLSPPESRLSSVEKSALSETKSGKQDPDTQTEPAPGQDSKKNHGSEQQQQQQQQQHLPATPAPGFVPTSSVANDLASMPADPSTSTVDRIYEQYHHSPSEQDVFHAQPRGGGLQAPESSTYQLGSASSKLSPANLSELRSGAGARCGFRRDDGGNYTDSDREPSSNQGGLQSKHPDPGVGHGLFTNQATTRSPLWPRLLSAGEAPPFSLPRIPTIEYSEPSDGHGYFHGQALSFGPSLSTLSDSQGLLNGDLHSDGLIPHPLALPAHEVAEDSSPMRRSRFSIGATSMGATTESNADPFEYDRYDVFPVSKKEREVSAVLQRLSTASRTSKSASPEKSPHKSFSLPSPIPEQETPSEIGYIHSVKSPATRFHFLDQDAIKSSWQVHQGRGEAVKVPVRPSPPPPVANEKSRQPGVLTAMNLNAREGEKVPSRHGASVTPSDNDDWETVATAKGAYSSPYCVPPGMPRNVLQMTGSSLADVSDDEISMYHATFDEYGSTERIVRHPSHGSYRGEQPPPKLRHIKDTKMPVFVPQQRVHRVNGLAQNSIRLLQDSCSREKTGPREKSQPRRLKTPFGIIGGSHKHSHKPSFNVGESCRFEFRDSGCSSNYGSQALPARNPVQKDGHHVSSDADTRAHEARTAKDYLYDSSVHRAPADNEDSFASADMSGTSHSFNFPLISLPEAARIQALRRESGLDDQTVTGNERTRKESFASSRKTKGTFDSIRLPRMPENAHRRVPTPLFGAKKPRNKGAKSGEPHGSYDDAVNTSPLSSKMDSPPDHGSRGSNGYGTSTATFGSSPLKNKLSGIWPSRRSQIPRLYPWDERRMQQLPPASDPSLRALANRAKLPGSMALTYMSSEGRAKQRRWFLAMLVVSTIFPFLAVLVYFGRLDGLLSYYTKGEATELTQFQRKMVLAVMLLGFFIWTTIVVVVVKKLGGAF
ncbi:hypothetical protein RB595_003385 [Gaeumannomyces hyphopodioides]